MSRNYTHLCNYSHRQKREPVLPYIVFNISLFIPVLSIISFDFGCLSTPSFKHKCCYVFFSTEYFFKNCSCYFFLTSVVFACEISILFLLQWAIISFSAELSFYRAVMVFLSDASDIPSKLRLIRSPQVL